ncbi:MAG: choice-of-anchor tandem repeat GloVer-containing protein [Bryobacteraceae bacterium]
MNLRLTLLPLVYVSAAFAQPALTTLYSFPGYNGDGANPYAGVTLGSNGSLYGTTGYGGTYGAGAVYELTPPVSGNQWIETVLYSFAGGTDGGYPQGGVVLGSGGVLYGATKAGGSSGMGVVFELTPPGEQGGAWTETAIYSFSGSDGATPYASPIVAPSGVLYGTTELGGSLGYGTVYELAPPAGDGAWTETVLYNFAGGNDGAFPYASLAIDAAGNLYGTTDFGGSHNKGTVFKLAPPTKLHDSWKEAVIHTFTGKDGGYPYAGLVLDTAGDLYGATPGGVGTNFGTVYELTPPATGNVWNETVLKTFNAGVNGGAPHAVPAFGPGGTLLGTTLAGGSSSAWKGYGVVYELQPPVTGKAWTETVLYTFKDTANGGDPDAPLIPGPNGVFYGTTLRGGANGQGTVFLLTP